MRTSPDPNKARNKAIVTLWNGGLHSYTAIARRLGLRSRNVVAGVVNRAQGRGLAQRPTEDEVKARHSAATAAARQRARERREAVRP